MSGIPYVSHDIVIKPIPIRVGHTQLDNFYRFIIIAIQDAIDNLEAKIPYYYFNEYHINDKKKKDDPIFKDWMLYFRVNKVNDLRIEIYDVLTRYHILKELYKVSLMDE
jgi:hypothetical protein